MLRLLCGSLQLLQRTKQRMQKHEISLSTGSPLPAPLHVSDTQKHSESLLCQHIISTWQFPAEQYIFSPIHSRRMGLQTSYFCSNTLRSIAELFLCASRCRIARLCARLVARVKPRPLTVKNKTKKTQLVFIYWWRRRRSSEWENWVTASAEQQLTQRGWCCLEKAAGDCEASVISLNNISHSTGTTLILTVKLHCHQGSVHAS